MPQRPDVKQELEFLHSYLDSAATDINVFSQLFHAHVNHSGSAPQLIVTEK